MVLNGINEVSEATGIHPASLRRWESMGLISADRIAFGQTWMRVYSDDDLELLKQVKRLMDQGYKLKWAFEKARDATTAE